jgi:hypothetical protein
MRPGKKEIKNNKVTTNIVLKISYLLSFFLYFFPQYFLLLSVRPNLTSNPLLLLSLSRLMSDFPYILFFLLFLFHLLPPPPDP